MKLIPRIFCCLAMGVLAGKVVAATNELSDAEREGRELARQLCELRPAENLTNSGVLIIREAKKKSVEVPAEFRTVVTPTNWLASYKANWIRGLARWEIVTIIHNDSETNRISIRKDKGDATDTKIVSGNQTMTPFADSDFWLADLGLEFFHWPGQKLLKKEVKRGQSCSVLESVNSAPATNGYSRVVSWIDIDTGGIVQAEAYDAKNKLLKEFEPTEFKKVNGQWQVQELEMRNVQTGSRSRLLFNLQSKSPPAEK